MPTLNKIEKLLIDDNNVVHMVILHKGSWTDASHNFQYDNTYMYMTYDTVAKTISTPITIDQLIADYSPQRMGEFQNECPHVENYETLEEINTANAVQAANIKTAYLNKIFSGAIAHYSFEKVTREEDSGTYIDTYYTETRLLALSRHLTNYEASVIAKNLFQQYSDYTSRILELIDLRKKY